MKKIFFLAIAQLIITFSFAQTISFAHDTVSLNQSSAAGSIISMYNNFTNTGTTNVVYRWKMQLLSAPAGWTFTICDNIACAAEGVDTATFNVDSAANCLMVCDMMHHGTAGTGVGKLKITNLSDTTDNHTIYYFGSMFLNTGIYEAMQDASIHLSPNPVVNMLHFQSAKAIEKGECLIMSMTGEIVARTSIANQTSFDLDLSNLASGNYLALVKDEQNKTMLSRTIQKQ